MTPKKLQQIEEFQTKNFFLKDPIFFELAKSKGITQEDWLAYYNLKTKP